MTYEVVYSPTARREMSAVPARVIPAIIEFVFGDLAANPRRVGKPLTRELAGSFSARRGSYRILYD
ncbi:MAG: type II toxin-antitoxin system RelE/ParE family toxin, partial [Rhodoglobus sp.]